MSEIHFTATYFWQITTSWRREEAPDILIKSKITTQFPPPFLMTKLWTTTQIFREMYRSKLNYYLLPVKLQRLIFKTTLDFQMLQKS